MSLPRESTVRQLKKLRKLTKNKDIGDISKKNKERNMPNSYWIDNPLDRRIDTYGDFTKKNKKKVNESIDMEKDAFIIWENYIKDNEDFLIKNKNNINIIIEDVMKKNKHNEEVKYMYYDLETFVKDHIDTLEYSLTESHKGPGGDSLFVNNFKDKLNKIPMNILIIGKQIDLGDIKGYINNIDNEYVYISPLGGMEEIKITYKEYIKKLNKIGKITESSGFPSEYWTIDEEFVINDDIDEELAERELEREEEFTNGSKIRRYNKPRRYVPKRTKPNREIKLPGDYPNKNRNIRFGTEDNPI